MTTAMTDYLVVVSGLPRCGTSMMMRMLEAGGLPVVTDGVRTPTEDNPAGFYEYERVKKTKEDSSWVAPALGKAVKMVYQLMYDMPTQYNYRVLCMRREMAEILASQRAMLVRSGQDADAVGDAQIAQLFNKALSQFESWVQAQPNVEMVNVSYNGILKNGQSELSVVNQFLDNRLDVDAMLAIVEPSLYRNRE
jgi:hypothetical protein